MEGSIPDPFINIGFMNNGFNFASFSRDFEILGWCTAGPVLPHREKVPL